MPRFSFKPVARVKEKDAWHLYGLQELAPQKFAEIVNRILSGRNLVINPKSRGTAP